MGDSLKYEKRAVSASKKEVHEAIKHLDKGLYPNAFCKILPDYIGRDERYCNIMHSDTAGTKTSLAYLRYKETGDPAVWRGIAQDALVMNIDDMACVGALNNIVISSTIGRNKTLIPGEVINEIVGFFGEFSSLLESYGINIYLAGGETADVGDIVRTIDVGYTTFARIKRADVIVNHIKPGNVIVGFSSSGQASYEHEYNSGIGSNGLTSARHDILHNEYAILYPESRDPSVNPEYQYVGNKRLEDTIPVGDDMIEVGDIMLSPTRTYIPLIKEIIEEKDLIINGMIHCTGGGQGKVLHFADNVQIIKNNLFPLPPVFKLIESESGLSRKEMYQVFNMGHRLEIYTDEPSAIRMIKTAEKYNIDAQIIGHVVPSEECTVYITDDRGTYELCP